MMNLSRDTRPWKLLFRILVEGRIRAGSRIVRGRSGGHFMDIQTASRAQCHASMESKRLFAGRLNHTGSQ